MSKAMKNAAITRKGLLLSGAVVLFGMSAAVAQDGIYDDIRQVPTYDTGTNTSGSNPLDGYSTYDQDDYYQPQNSSTSNNTQQYVDESGNTYITNNYYGDYDDDYDYFYASRINRFHRPIWGFGYYDPFYTNMYWYNYDPFWYGTSIYAGWGWGGFYRPWGWNPWGWGGGFGWGGGWYNNWGWNGWGYSPYCFGGGWGGYGMGYNQGYWNGYNHGYWNGYYDGLAMGGGYYNTYDMNSGIYYGHRAGVGNTGSGVRAQTLGERYNRAAAEGLVSHANRNNVLQTADARPVVGRTNLDGYSIDRKPSVNSRDVQTVPTRNGNVTSVPSRSGDERSTTAPAGGPVRNPSGDGREVIRQEGGNVNVPQRTPHPYTPANTPQRTPQNVQEVPQRNPQTQQGVQTPPQRVPQGQGNVQPAPQRNPQQYTPQTAPQRTPQTAPQRTPQGYGDRVPQPAPQRPGTEYQAPVRTPQPTMQPHQPQREVYQRGSAPNTMPPAYRGPGNPQQTQPSQQVPSRNYGSPQPQLPPREVAPSRPQQQPVAPSRTAPSRNDAPVRDFSPQRSAPSPGPSRGVSPSPAPSRGGGGFSAPSRGGGGAPSGGRR